MTDRAVSVTVNFVLGLAVATLLITGLLFAAGDLIGDRRESTVRGELRIVGERIASDLMTADRLAQTGAETVVLRSSSPEQVAGAQYSVRLDGANREIVLEVTNPGVTVRVPFHNTTDVTDSKVAGGDVRIVLTSGNELEVRST